MAAHHTTTSGMSTEQDRLGVSVPERLSMLLGGAARGAWERFLGDGANRGHATRELHGGTLDTHVAACLRSADETIARVKADIGDHSVRVALEVGASTGMNCFALQAAFPDATVVGIEPEHEALVVASTMDVAARRRRPLFVEGIGETLPFADGSVDLIVCHTVIEHVYDVGRVVREMSRVLSPRGILHLEAPNYVWPWEPHLSIWCLPLLGKPLIALMARLQGKGKMVPFLDHLQLVHPRLLEREFRAARLQWINRIEAKVSSIMSGDRGAVKAYHRMSGLLGGVGRSRAGRLLVRAVIGAGIYPSVMYTVTHARREDAA